MQIDNKDAVCDNDYAMKIESIVIHNFKRFDSLEVSFSNKTLNEVSNRFMVLGDNGSGKTTLLQAIALPLALATQQIKTVEEFDWIGFQAGRYSRWGPPHIELDVSFANDEIAATIEVARAWNNSPHSSSADIGERIKPGESKLVHLVLDGDRCYAPTPAEYYQFRGRFYARQLLKTNNVVRELFNRLPGIFWFDQFRNLGTNHQIAEVENGNRERAGRISYDFGVARLRERLNGWKLAQMAKSESYSTDYLLLLENLYKQVFPGRSFAGVEPMPDVDTPTARDFYFLLNDGHRTYDIEEMSAGEQAIFPILYDFVRLQISNSVVLIDEIDQLTSTGSPVVREEAAENQSYQSICLYHPFGGRQQYNR